MPWPKRKPSSRSTSTFHAAGSASDRAHTAEAYVLIGLSVRRLKDGKSYFDEKLLQLTGLEHFAHYVASADESALDVELRDRGPVGVDLDAIPQFGPVVHIERLVMDPNVFENLDHLTRKSTLWKLRRAFHEEHDVVRPYFVLDELIYAHDPISSFCSRTQRPPYLQDPGPENPSPPHPTTPRYSPYFHH